jgi:hypothetical protein
MVFCMVDLVAGASDRRAAAGIFGGLQDAWPRDSTCSYAFKGYISRVLVYGINYSADHPSKVCAYTNHASAFQGAGFGHGFGHVRAFVAGFVSSDR